MTDKNWSVDFSLGTILEVQTKSSLRKKTKTEIEVSLYQHNLYRETLRVEIKLKLKFQYFKVIKSDFLSHHHQTFSRSMIYFFLMKASLIQLLINKISICKTRESFFCPEDEKKGRLWCVMQSKRK